MPIDFVDKAIGIDGCLWFGLDPVEEGRVLQTVDEHLVVAVEVVVEDVVDVSVGCYFVAFAVVVVVDIVVFDNRPVLEFLEVGFVELVGFVVVVLEVSDSRRSAF